MSAIYKLPRDRVVYNYRYFLPYAPEWGTAEFCEQRLTELLTFCREARIDAVQFYVNSLPGTYYMPPRSAAEQEQWARWMKTKVAPAVRQAGLSYQLNFQMLLGASSQGLDMRDEYDWEFLVDQHGQETLGCACPLSPVFRKQMGEMLRLWADTEPDVLWIDDDFRMHNHGLGNSQMDVYCYCKRHLDEFAKRAGQEYRREELVAEVLRPGKPSRLRTAWLDFLGQTMTETAGWIRREVHGVSPHTRLAQMTSAPDVHAGEGRDWKAFLTALCGEHPPMTRPCCGCYTGTMVPLKDQTVSYRFMGQSIAVLEQVFGPSVMDYGPELENTRFTTWCKSVANTQYVLMLTQLLGCPQITLSMNDLDGSPITDEPTTVPVLRDMRPRLEALAALTLRDWQPQGAVFLSDPASAHKVQLGPAARMQDLGLIRRWEDMLLQMGIPAHYLSPAQAASSRQVVVLEEYTAWCASDAELEEILAGSVLLDGEAAKVLQERGFGEAIGVAIGSAPGHGIMAEVFGDKVLTGLEARRVPHRGTRWHKMTLNGATPISQFVDAKNRHYIGSAFYENRGGGRVVVYAGSGDCMPMGLFANHARLRWLHGVLRWLSRESFCMLPIISHQGLSVVRNGNNETLFGFANLGTDAMTGLTVRLPLKKPLGQVRVLDPSGTWQDTVCTCQAAEVPGAYIVTVPCRLNAFDWLILRWTDPTG